MYKVYCDDILVCDSRVEELALTDPVVNLEENKAGSFSFKMPPKHPLYGSIKRRKSVIQVYQNDDLIFSGICIKEKEDFYKQKIITCEGELTYLNDTIQRPKYYRGKNVRGLLEAYIAVHNSQVEERKQFSVGMITVSDDNDYISCYTNMQTTMKEIKEDLVDDLGGFLQVRHSGGVKYIDYLADSQNTNTQEIRIGRNLLDFTKNFDSSDIATAIIPQGAKLEETAVEGLETRLTIESVNDGVDYVHSPEAVEEYGWVYKTVTWDGVTTPDALKTKAEKYLSDIQFENMVIEAKAIDLNLTNQQMERFKLSDKIRVVSAPHGLDRYFRLTKMTINLNHPDKNTITLGKSETVKLSARMNKENEKIKKAIEIMPSTILQNAVQNATQLIQNATNGFVTTVMNDDGTPKELLIMDTPEIATATKVWRWNINGLGYSSNGYKGPYALAMTMDGSIVADFITAGTMLANRIRGGELSLGGKDNKDGVLYVYDDDGNLVGYWKNAGIHVSSSDGTDACNIRDGFIQFYFNEKLYSVIGVGDLKIGDNPLKALAFRNTSDVIVFSDESTAYYIINPYNKTITRSGYTENHYFKGSARISDGLFVKEITFHNGLPKIYGTSYDGAKAVAVDGGFYTYGSMGCSGTKYRVVDTEHYGKRGMNAFETSEAYFSDIGSGVIDEDGTCRIDFDPVFIETIEKDKPYQVQFTRTSEKEVKWVEKNKNYFVVHGDAGATFDWMLMCKQKGYADVRMLQVNINEPDGKGV